MLEFADFKRLPMPESHGVRDLPEDIDDDISCFQITDRCHCGKLKSTSQYYTIIFIIEGRRHLRYLYI